MQRSVELAEQEPAGLHWPAVGVPHWQPLLEGLVPRFCNPVVDQSECLDFLDKSCKHASPPHACLRIVKHSSYFI